MISAKYQITVYRLSVYEDIQNLLALKILFLQNRALAKFCYGLDYLIYHRSGFWYKTNMRPHGPHAAQCFRSKKCTLRYIFLTGNPAGPLSHIDRNVPETGPMIAYDTARK